MPKVCTYMRMGNCEDDNARGLTPILLKILVCGNILCIGRGKKVGWVHEQGLTFLIFAVADKFDLYTNLFPIQGQNRNFREG